MRLIRGIMAAAVLLMIGAVVLIVALPGERIAKLAADQVKAQTGRALTFGGPVGISWYPVLGVSAQEVRFANADWSEQGPMFAAQKAVIGVDVMAALGGAIRIKNIELEAPDVILERTAEGRANWELTSGAAEAASVDSASGQESAAGSGADRGTSLLAGVTLERLVMRDARVRYIEHGGARQEIAGLSMTMRWPGQEQAAELTVEAAPFGAPLQASATVGAPLQLLQGGVAPLKAVVTAPGGAARFDGRVGLAPEASGALDVEAADAAAFLAAFGQGGLDGPLSASGDVTLTQDGRVSLRGGSVAALGNVLSVQADVVTSGERPQVTAQVATDVLRFEAAAAADDGAAAAAGAATPGAAQAGWSKAPIDASALGLVDGTITFAAERMALSGFEFGRTRATVAIDRARAVVTVSEMAAYEGAVTGSFVANNRDGLSVRGDLSVTQIALQPFLQATAGLSRFTGKADFSTRFLSSGQSVDALMTRLSGDGRVEVGRGTIEGMDLDRLLRGDVTGGTTVFDTMSASWTIADGVLRNEDLIMSLPRLQATGAGTVGLGLQTIDYLFTPQIRGTEAPKVIVPVKIRGSWQNPSIVPDLSAAIETNFEEELKAVEDSAKAKVQEELGLTPQEGQSTEDALKDKLEKEAKRSLRNLLGVD